MATGFSRESRISFVIGILCYAVVLWGGYLFYSEATRTVDVKMDICSGTDYGDQITGAAIIGYVFGLPAAVSGLMGNLRNGKSKVSAIALAIASAILITTAPPLGHYIQDKTIAAYQSKFSGCR